MDYFVLFKSVVLGTQIQRDGLFPKPVRIHTAIPVHALSQRKRQEIEAERILPDGNGAHSAKPAG